MVNNLTISLIPEYRENFPIVKEYLQNKGFGIVEIDIKEIEKTIDTDLSILFIDILTDEKIIFIESNLKNKPIIISYNNCPDTISIESFSKEFTFHYKQELNVLPALIENAVLKNQIRKSEVNEIDIEPKFLGLLNKILANNINKVQLDKFTENVVENISKYSGANEFHLFLLPKFKNLNIGLKSDIINKYNIRGLLEYYPKIEYDSLLKSLEKNQDLIIFKKNSNGDTNIVNEKTRQYHCLIAFPVFINNTLYGCIILNYQKPNDKISKRQKEIRYLVKIFSLQIQYKIVYNQYEKSISQFRRLIHDAVNGIYQSTEEGKIIYANPAFIKIVGFDSLDELKKINLFTELYSSKSDREEFIKKITEEKTVQNYESLLRKKSGETINIIENSRMVKNPDGSIFFQPLYSKVSHRCSRLLQKSETMHFQ